MQWAIARGETVTGVSSMMMTEALDAGDILLQQEVTIAPEDTGATLHDKLAAAAADVLRRTLEAMRGGTLARRPQDAREVTCAPKLVKEDGKVLWTMPARDLHNRVRAFNPWPGAFCTAPGGRMLKLRRTRVEAGAGPAGTVLDGKGDGPLVAAGEGALRLLEVQPEGKRPMSGADYVRGHALRAGDAMA